MNSLLDPKYPTVVVGGFGSNHECMSHVAGQLQATCEQPVTGMTTHEMRAAGEKFWDCIEGTNVIAYSGSGPYIQRGVVKGRSAPRTMTFAAPPEVVSRYAAIMGFTQAARRRVSPSERSSLGVATAFVQEVGRHPVESWRLVHELRRFNQIAGALALQSVVPRVNVVVPKEDEIFPRHIVPLSYGQTDQVGVRYVLVEGGHSRFIDDPVGMLCSAEMAPFAVIDHETFARDIPDQLLQDKNNAVHRRIGEVAAAARAWSMRRISPFHTAKPLGEAV